MIQPTLLVAFQLQPVPAVTETVPVAAADVKPGTHGTFADESLDVGKQKRTYRLVVPKGVDLDKPLKDADASELTKKLDMPAGSDLRLFSDAGVPLYATPGLAQFPADDEGLQAANVRKA